MQLHKAGEPVIRALRDELGETCYLDVIDGYERVCIISFEGTKPVRSVVPLGQRAPLYAGADGRVLLAWWDDEALQKFFETVSLVPITERTIIKKDQLLAELQRTREQGYAVSYGEYHPGSIGVAAPVRDAAGRVVAGVSVSFPDSLEGRGNLDRYIHATIKAAETISSRLGYVSKRTSQKT